MSLTVSLNLYSGLPNPEWVIEPKQLSTIFAKAVTGRQLPKLPVRAPGYLGRLGYSGFTIDATGEDELHGVYDLIPRGVKSVYVDTGLLDLGRPGPVIDPNDWPDSGQWSNAWPTPNLWDSRRTLERELLLEAQRVFGGRQFGVLLRAEGEMSDQHVRDLLETIIALSTEFATELELADFRKLAARFTSAWDHPMSQRWNSPDEIRKANNCYNFATDCRTETKPAAQPGRGSTGQRCDDALEGAISDGLRLLKISSAPDPRTDYGHHVGLETSGRYYHWYRQLADGMWCHKIGSGFATNLDNDDQPISDPQFCSRGTFTWRGYFFCPDCYKLKVS